jgi:hypothetical protein
VYICCNCLNLRRYFLCQSLLHNMCPLYYITSAWNVFLKFHICKMMWIILHYHIYQVNICRLLATFWYVIQIFYDKVNSIIFSMQPGVSWGNKKCVWCFSMFVFTPTVDLCCVWLIYPVVCWFWCLEIGIASVNWVQLNRILPGNWEEGSISKMLFLNKRNKIVQKLNNCSNYITVKNICYV